LMACSLSNVTLPSDFLIEAIIDGALAAAKQESTKRIISCPNFFIALTKLFGGGSVNSFPAEKIFQIAEIEFKKFRREFDLLFENENDQNENKIMEYQHQEHDWISAMYELAFTTHDRALAINFLEHQIDLKTESILKHAMRFADPKGKINPDFNRQEAGSYDPDSGRLIEQTSSNETSISNSSELFIQNENNNNNTSYYFPSSLQELSERTKTILQTSLPLSQNHSSNAALAMFLSSSSQNMNNNNDDLTVANRRISSARSCFVLHHSMIQSFSLDPLREAIDRCHQSHAVLVVPSTVLLQLTAFTASSTSRSGRLTFEEEKKKVIRALFGEFVDGRAFLVSPAEEVLIRFHEGHADADTLVWEVCSFLQARAPTTSFHVLAEEGSRTANRLDLFARPNTLSTVVSEEMKSTTLTTENNKIAHPLLKHLDPQILNNHMRRDKTGAVVDHANPMFGERVAGVLWNPNETRGVDSHFRSNVASRIRDPVGQKFMPGQFFANNRGDRYSNQDMRNNLDVSQRKKLRRSLQGHSFNAILDDLNGLGIYTPHHQ
jgi:hypothetical protein